MSRLVQIRPVHSPTQGAAPEPTHAAEITAHPLADDPIDTEAIPGPRVYLETLGCQMNEADSAIIMGQLRAGGYVRVADPAAADVILLNTCAPAA